MRDKWESIDETSMMFDFRWFYAGIASSLPDGGTAVEVGLSNGKSAIFFIEKLLDLGKKFRFVGVDNLSYGSDIQLSAIVSNFVRADVAQYIELMPVDSLIASCRFPDQSLDFVFLDSSHEYEPTKAEIRCWLPKIKDGGILAGHDYHEIEKVRNAVHEVLPENCIKSEQTDNGLGVWWVEKTPKMLAEKPKDIVDRELRKMISDTHSRIGKSNNTDDLFKLSEYLNGVLEEINNPKILV